MTDNKSYNWWESDLPPWEKWPGVSIKLEAIEQEDGTLLSPCGNFYYDQEEAELVVQFFPALLRHYKGRHAGQAFELLPWQADLIIRPLFGWKRVDNGTRRFRTCFTEVAKKNGKALGVQTPVPTPHGMKPLGWLNVGDYVIGSQGTPVKVVAKSPVMKDRPCYRVTFSDGISVVADEEHQWATTHKDQGYGIRTTRDLLETLHQENGDPAHLISSPSLNLTAGMQELPADERKSPENVGRGMAIYSPNGVPQEVRSAAFRSNRTHFGDYPKIPDEYLFNSRDVQQAVLRGLMDQDGEHQGEGLCTFSTTSQPAAVSLAMLLRVLGYEYGINVQQKETGRADPWTKTYDYVFNFEFQAYREDQVFTSRDRNQELPQAPGDREPFRVFIVDIQPIESEPVQCIQVDAPDGLFCFGHDFILTHNSGLASGIALYLLAFDGEPGAEVYSAAADQDQARIVFQDSRVMVEQSTSLENILEVLRSAIVYPAKNSSYKVLSASVGTKHGFNVHGLIFDEFHTQKTTDLYDTLKKGTAARDQPVTFIITTAGSDKETPCGVEYDYAKNVISGVIEDDSYLPVIFEAAPTDDWADPETWKKANPSFGVTVLPEYLEQEVTAAKAEPRKLNAFLRLHLNRWTESDEAWIPPDDWDACAGPIDLEELKNYTCAVGIDLSSKIDLSAMALVFRVPDNPEARPLVVDPEEIDADQPLSINYSLVILTWCWAPEETIHRRSKEDKVPYDLWADQGHLLTTPGALIDYDFLLATLENEIIPHFKPQQFGFDEWNATQFATHLQKQGYLMVPVRQGYQSLSEPSKVLEAMVRAGRVRHIGSPLMRWCISNAVIKSDENGNIRPVKRNPKKRIDPVMAVIMAISRLLTLDDERPSVYEERGILVI